MSRRVSSRRLFGRRIPISIANSVHPGQRVPQRLVGHLTPLADGLDRLVSVCIQRRHSTRLARTIGARENSDIGHREG